jgi:crossover junction endodeoxyribonuclease RuvC
MNIILGIDPGLQRTGWGMISYKDNTLSLVGCGIIRTKEDSPIAERVLDIGNELGKIIDLYRPQYAAVEETFVNINGQSTLKLGQARGAILLALAQSGLSIAEYAATLVKKTVSGNGRAEKGQVARMVQILLPGCGQHGADAMDALAVAICHAHHSRGL